MEKKLKMKNCTINLPNLYDEVIQKLISLKIVPSRSEAIRMAIQEFLAREEQITNFFKTIVDSQGETNSSWSKTKFTIKSIPKKP